MSAHPPSWQEDEWRSHPVQQQGEFSVGRCLRRAIRRRTLK
ncbi:hypothetical protein [Nostoc sp. CHAB 5836]|nr:hypothetical protein [Nostoc sp. CHAB 5836]